jgi:hypothetical protein
MARAEDFQNVGTEGDIWVEDRKYNREEEKTA